MKKIILASAVSLLLPALVFAQNNGMEIGVGSSFTIKEFAAMLELPFIIFSVFLGFGVAFIVSQEMRSGFLLLASGILVMAVGHLLLMGQSLFNFFLPVYLFGPVAGSLVWLGALALTWGLIGLGLWRLRKLELSK
ncbi:MAG: hypothetical protein AAB628_03070 [Patescibacteria group bacterium]